MSLKTILGLTWIAIGIFELISAHFFIAKKNDLFADPNTQLAILWIKPLKRLRILITTLIESGIVDQNWIIDLTVRLMTQMGLALILLGFIILTYPWSTIVAIIISAFSLSVILAYFIISFCSQCISISRCR